MRLVPHEGFMTMDNDNGRRAWARAYVLPIGSAASILVAQHYYQPVEGSIHDHQDSFYLGFVMGNTLKKAVQALSTGQFDRGNANDANVLVTCQMLRSLEIFEDMATLAKERGVARCIAVPDKTPVIDRICTVLHDDLAFKKVENDSSVEYIKEF